MWVFGRADGGVEAGGVGEVELFACLGVGGAAEAGEDGGEDAAGFGAEGGEVGAEDGVDGGVDLGRGLEGGGGGI